jgi:hypothetical protein
MKRCFVLGAGASIGHTNGLFPAINSFFKAYLEHQKIIDGMDFNAKELKPLDIYLKTCYGYSIGDGIIDIERIFTGIETDLEGYPEDSEIITIRSTCIKFIKVLLVKLQKNLSIDRGEYHLLNEILQTSDTIITFNWDCLLDDILGRKDILEKKKSGVQNDQYSNFYHSLTCIAEYLIRSMSPPYPYVSQRYNQFLGIKTIEPKKDEEPAGYYLKMHGSVDWLYCKNPSCETNQHIFPVENPLKLMSCGYCLEDLYSLIIPPLLNKGIREHPTIRRIWNRARSELMLAQEVIIWGYSLPSTDFYSDWLLRQARTGRLKKVVLINKALSPENSEAKELRTRLLEPFRGILDEPGQIEEFLTFPEYHAAVSSGASA